MGVGDSVTNEPKLVSIQIGLPQVVTWNELGESKQQSWETGFLKEPVSNPIRLGATQLAGDGQADLKHHGGVDKAVCVYPLAHYPFWRNELSLPDFQNGAFGENFTVDGLTESDVCIGDTWTVGDAVVQISQPRQPCWKLARRWNIKDLAVQVQNTGRTGWYFRVLTEGMVAAPGTLKLIERRHPEWTVAAANQIMHHDKRNRVAAANLAAIEELSSSWKATLRNRAEKGREPNTQQRLGGKE